MNEIISSAAKVVEWLEAQYGLAENNLEYPLAVLTMDLKSKIKAASGSVFYRCEAPLKKTAEQSSAIEAEYSRWLKNSFPRQWGGALGVCGRHGGYVLYSDLHRTDGGLMLCSSCYEEPTGA